MAEQEFYSPLKEIDGHAAAHIRAFSETRKLSLPPEDATGNLLNEAVAFHLDSANHAGPDTESIEEEAQVSAILRKKVNELEASRKKFSRYLSDEQKARIARSPNTTDTILALIDSADFDWCSRSTSGVGVMAALKGKFHKACASLDQHVGLLSMLPKDSEYVSVFYGALNSIVAASVMHQAMATGLPKIVDELNAVVSDLSKKIELFPQAKRQMRRVLIELYTRIFDLFARLMKWYSSNNHCWKLMKKDCYNAFENDLRSVRTWADLVNREAWNNMVLELRKTHDDDKDSRDEERRIQRRFRQDILEVGRKFYEFERTTAMHQTVQREQLAFVNSETYRDSLAELVVEKFARYFNVVGANQTGVLASMIDDKSPRYISTATYADAGTDSSSESYDTTAQSFIQAVNNDTQRLDLDSNKAHLNVRTPQLREDIERYSHSLDAYYPEGSMHPMRMDVLPASRPVLHESISSQIYLWTRSTTSQVLYLQLPYTHSPESLGSALASHIVSSAWEANHPIISHFCALPREVTQGRSPQTVALTSMLLSLIRQLVGLLPSILPENSVSLNESRFASLDGTLRTWDQMLDIFSDLLSLAAPSILIIIHGLQVLDSQRTTPLLGEWLAVIRKSIKDLDRLDGQTIKVLFVTEGQSRALVPWLQRGEHLIHEGSRRSRHQLASV